MRRPRGAPPFIPGRLEESKADTARRFHAAAQIRKEKESARLTTTTWQRVPQGSDSSWGAGESRTTRPRLAGGVMPARARREGRSGLRRERAESEMDWAAQEQAGRE